MMTFYPETFWSFRGIRSIIIGFLHSQNEIMCIIYVHKSLFLYNYYACNIITNTNNDCIISF